MIIRGCVRLALGIGLALFHIAVHAQWPWNATTLGGVTPSTFRVSETGAATYSIPIQVPPGLAGLEPKLTLVYNSQGPNGLLGIGWSIDGLPTIHRCGRTLEQDGVRLGVTYEPGDMYCLNGQRLVAISGQYVASGTEYRTERESFTKVVSFGTAGNGPASFKAWTKAGQVLEFGGTTESAIEAQGKQTIRVFAVNKISDSIGNYLTVSYFEDTPNGEYFPTRIDYTSNDAQGLTPFASVRFTYGPRLDVIETKVAGSKLRVSTLITNIRTYVGEMPVRDYKLYWGFQNTTLLPSTLWEVTECSGDGAFCLLPVKFNWSSPVLGNYPPGGKIVTGGQATSAGGWKVAELFGDGTQLFYTVQGDGTHRATRITKAGTAQNFTWNGGHGIGDAGWAVGDLFGDGKEVYYTHSANGTHYATRLNPDGTVQNWTWTGGHGVGSSGWALVDLFGDGRKVYYTANPGANYATRFNPDGTVQNWTWSGFNPPPSWSVGDLFGDGRNEIYYNFFAPPFIPFHVAIRLNEDGTLQSWQWQDPDIKVCDCGWRLTNLFGDGRSLFFTPGGAGAYATRFNPDGTLEKWQWNDGAGVGNIGWEVADWWGDGRELYTTHVTDGSVTTHWLTRFKPDGTFDRTYLQSTFGSGAGGWAIADLTGEGKKIYYTHDGAGTHFTSRIPKASNADVAPAYVITGFGSTGLNSTMSVSYNVVTDSSVHTRDLNSAYPIVDLKAPLWVVSRTVDSVRPDETINYTYTGGKVHLRGGGFLGFRQVQAAEQATGIKTTTSFRQDYPFQRIVTSVARAQPNGAALGAVSNTWTDTQFSASTGGRHHRSDLTQSVETGNDLNGATLPTRTTTISYDAFGNAGIVGVSTGDGYSKTTVNTYSNDPNLLRLGRVTRAEVSSVIPSSTETKTRTSGFEYDAATGLVIREAVEPGDPNLCLVTTYTYDTYGNRTGTLKRNCNGTSSGGLVEAPSPTGAALFTPRNSVTLFQTGTVTINTASYSYPAGQFPTFAKNAEDQIETRTFDPRFGGMMSLTGPNQVSTAWTYDSFGRNTSEARPDGTTTNWAYTLCDTCGVAGARYAVVTSATGSATSTSMYDLGNRVFRSEVQGFDGTAIRTDTQFDSLGRISKTSKPYFVNGTPSWTTYEYDILGRVVAVTDPDDRRSTMTYDGLTTTVTNVAGRSEVRIKNSQGQVTKVIRSN